MISSCFLQSKIDLAIFVYDGNKSPSHNGFNFYFWRRLWHLMRDDMRILFAQFHSQTYIPLSFFSYFMTLILKVESLSHFNEFRHISLVMDLYKLVAKGLTAGLAKVMEKLISPNQLTFLKGRFMIDEVVVENELVDLTKRSKKDFLLFKVDFEKSYDSSS